MKRYYVHEDAECNLIGDKIYASLQEAVRTCPPGGYVISKPDDRMCFACPTLPVKGTARHSTTKTKGKK